MKINAEKCIGCGSCYPYCPGDAIILEDDVARIDEDLCFECGTCLRVEVCPVEAIYEPDYVYEYPRSVRKFFSDPSTKHSETNMPGRGTEEVKTNDVTNRVEEGYGGLALEVGRPTVGTRLGELEKVTKTLAENGFDNFVEDNPVYALMEDPAEGTLKDEVLDERILSAIIELKIPENDLQKCLNIVEKISKKIDTVFSMSLISHYDSGMKISLKDIIENSNFKFRPNAKVNIGVGRKLNERG